MKELTDPDEILYTSLYLPTMILIGVSKVWDDYSRRKLAKHSNFNSGKGVKLIARNGHLEGSYRWNVPGKLLKTCKNIQDLEPEKVQGSEMRQWRENLPNSRGMGKEGGAIGGPCLIRLLRRTWGVQWVSRIGPTHISWTNLTIALFSTGIQW